MASKSKGKIWKFVGPVLILIFFVVAIFNRDTVATMGWSGMLIGGAIVLGGIGYYLMRTKAGKETVSDAKDGAVVLKESAEAKAEALKKKAEEAKAAVQEKLNDLTTRVNDK